MSRPGLQAAWPEKYVAQVTVLNIDVSDYLSGHTAYYPVPIIIT
jgi:hypothetical protein